jgi:hypothetical protein
MRKKTGGMRRKTPRLLAEKTLPDAELLDLLGAVQVEAERRNLRAR